MTIASDLDDFYLKNFLIPSCNFFNLNLTIIHFNKKWTGHRNKDALLLKYLDEIDEKEIVLFTDAYDTMMLCDEEQLMKSYEKKGTPIVFSSEMNCWPFPGLKFLYQKKYPMIGNSFLNSGGFMGKAIYIKELLKKYKAPPSYNFRELKEIRSSEGLHLDDVYAWSNQYYWTLVFLSEPDLISLDYENNIFITLGTPLNVLTKNADDYEKSGKDSKVYREEVERLRKTFAAANWDNLAHLHFNGPIVKPIFKEMHGNGKLPDSLRTILSDSSRTNNNIEIVPYKKRINWFQLWRKRDKPVYSG